MAKKLLIVSYSFPPAPGIGGRRWAKFAKYLVRNGYDVSVLTSENISDSFSTWSEDANNIKIETLPFNFPKIVAYPKPGIINKIKYFLSIKYLKISDKGNYYDKTIFWKQQIQKKISEYITQKNVDCVIVTAGPFRIAYYVTEMKSKFKDVKFIVDFRDLWTNDSEITAFSKMAEARKNIERGFEKTTAQMADKIICVAETMKTYFATLTQAEKISVIPNGFDADDFNEVLGSRSTQDNKKVKFVFTGTLYINLEYIFEPFLKALKKIKDENKDLYRSVTFEFIGTFPTSYRLLIDKYDVKDCITIKQPLPLREVYKTINEADYCMLFLNNVYSFALSTKFCEYISQRKKIIIVSSKGEAVDFILNNKLGYWVNPETAYENLVNIIQATLNKDGAKWNSEFDINEFSLKKLTEHLIKQIEY